MDRFLIEGPVDSRARSTTSGAKNAALPCLAATLLTAEPVRADQPSRRRATSGRWRSSCGTSASSSASSPARRRSRRARSDRRTRPTTWSRRCAPRSSCSVRCSRAAGRVRVSLPGGCAIGVRPDRPAPGGVSTAGRRGHVEHGYVEAKAGRLDGRARSSSKASRSPARRTRCSRRRSRKARRVSTTPAREPEVVGPRAAAAGDGRADLGRRDRDDRDRRRRAPPRRRARRSCPTGSRRGPTRSRAPLTRGDVTVRSCRPEHLRSA